MFVGFDVKLLVKLGLTIYIMTIYGFIKPKKKHLVLVKSR